MINEMNIKYYPTYFTKEQKKKQKKIDKKDMRIYLIMILRKVLKNEKKN
jgi:hypothetical protein